MAKIALRAYTKEIDGYIDRGQYEQALAHCRYILKFFPKHTDTYRLMAKAYLESQRYGDASDVFQRVLSSIPDDFVSHLGMSIIREDEGNLDAAIWHMERAFEIQPANAAIQNELRRLYGRRDGIEPPKVRLTRGALARMYYKGELYPQAIAELRAAISADPQRPDLQLLLAKSYSRAGFKVEAADASTALLKKLPYCIEGNIILADILEHTGRSEDALGYRQRAIALNPYLGQVNPKAPTPELVPDNAISIEKLDWTPDKGVVAQPQWASSLGVDLDAQGQQAQETPDWLKQLDTGALFIKAGMEGGVPKVSPFVSTGEEQGLPFDLTGQQSPRAADEELIPDWMKDAGWEPSSGDTTTAERGYTFETPDVEAEEQLAPAEIPSWLRAIAPKQELGDELFEGEFDQVDPKLVEALDSGAVSWLGDTPSGPGDSIDTWLDTEKSGKPEGEESLATGLPDWLVGATAAGAAAVIHHGGKDSKTEAPVEDIVPASEPEIIPSFDEAFSDAEISAGAEIPDWLMELSAEGETEQISEQEPASQEEGIPGWLVGAAAAGAVEGVAALSGDETEEAPSAMGEPGEMEISPQDELLAELPTAEEEMPEWLMELGSLETAEQGQEAIAEDESHPEWMGELQPEENLKGLAEAAAVAVAVNDEELPDWLAEEGAETPVETTEVAVVGEERFEQVTQELPEVELVEQVQEIPIPVDELPATEREGITAKEEDEAFAWLEGLAAKQGASEALLLTPDERVEEPPDWVLKEAALVGGAAALARAAKDEETPTEEAITPDEALPPKTELEPILTGAVLKEEELPEDWMVSTEALDEENLFEWNPEEFELEGLGVPVLDQVEETRAPLPDLSEVSPEEYLPEWLRASGPESVVVQPEPSKEDNLPNWLSEMEGEESETAEPALAEWPVELGATPGEENLDWLPKVVSENEIPPQAIEPDQVSEWLSTLPAIEQPAGEPVPEEVLAKLTPTGSLRQESVDEWELASEAESAQTYGLDEDEEEKSVSNWAPEVLAVAAISRAVTDRDEEKHLEELGGIPEWLAEPEPGPEATPVGAASVQPAIEEPPVIEGDTHPGRVTGEGIKVPETGEIQLEPSSEQVVEDIGLETASTAADEEAAFAWLESLAVKQGATEALLLTPEERLEEPPEWVREESLQESSELEVSAQRESSEPESVSEEDQDELPDWLIGTAAVGAVEAMLAARDKTEEEPEPAQSDVDIEPAEETLVAEKPVMQPPVAQAIGEDETPPAPTEEIDAAYAWLESLAVRQGAEEALVLSPEERLEEAPEWVKQEAEAARETIAEGEVTTETRITGEEVVVEEIGEVETILEGVTEEAPVAEVPEIALTEEEVLELPEWLASLEEEPTPSAEGPSWIPPVEDLQKAGVVPLDLNQASLIEVERLPGVGFRRAQALIAYRDSYGPLTSIRDLAKVEGFDDELIGSLAAHTMITPVATEIEVTPELDEYQREEIAIPLVGEPGDPLYEARLAVNSSDLPVALNHYQALIQGQDRLPEVIQDLQQTLRHFPDDFTVWMALGDAQMRSGQVQAALTSYDKAEELLG